MRVLVTGGRDFEEIDTLYHALDQIHQETPITLIIEGGAKGADRLARRWADARNVPFVTEEADWTRHGKAAGPLRNGRMIKEHKPDLVVAFKGGKGTADCKAQARAAGVAVREVV